MLAAVLVVEAAAAPARTHECPATDNRCQAEHFERRASATANEHHRALYLFSASKSYLFAFDKTGDARDLCTARRIVDASLDVRDQPAELRAQAEAFRATLAARVQQEHAQCGAVRRGKRAGAPLVARRPVTAPEPPAELLPRPATAPEPPADPSEATAPAVTPLIDLQLADAEPPAPAHDASLLPMSPSRAPRERPAMSPSRAPMERSVHTPRPGRGLVLAGGVTLGVGVALTAATGVMGRRMLDTRQQLFALDSKVDTYATPDQASAGNALLNEYNTMKPRVLASGATVIVAAVLTSVGARRMARAASRTALAPAPGGLVFHARF
jgi:hypothetical protein